MREKIVVTSLICEEIVVYNKNLCDLFVIRIAFVNLWKIVLKPPHQSKRNYSIISTGEHIEIA